MQKILQAIGLVALMFLSILLKAWVLVTLWWWFIVPIFHLAPITKAVAYGLSAIIWLLTYTGGPADDKEKSSAEKIGQAVSLSIVSPLMCLLGGWVAHKLM